MAHLVTNVEILDKLPIHTAIRTMKLGAFSGLMLGLIQDAHSFARGRKVSYVEYISRKLHSEQEQYIRG